MCSLSLSHSGAGESKCWFSWQMHMFVTEGWLSLRPAASTCPRIVCLSSDLCQSKQHHWRGNLALMKNQRYDKWRIRWNGLPFMRHYHMSWQTFAVAVRACKSRKHSPAKEKKKAKESEWKALQFLHSVRSSKALMNWIVLSAVWICLIQTGM